MKLKKYAENNADWIYVFVRVLTGILFFMHGYSKFFGGTPVQLASKFGIAGVVELVVGVLLVLGLFTRFAGLIGAVNMLVAYLWVHLPNGFNPFVNKGEAALLFFMLMLTIFVKGAGMLGLDNKIKK